MGFMCICGFFKCHETHGCELGPDTNLMHISDSLYISISQNWKCLDTHEKIAFDLSSDYDPMRMFCNIILYMFDPKIIINKGNNYRDIKLMRNSS